MHEHPTGPACRAQARPGHAQAGRAPRAQCAPPLPAARPRPLIRTPARHAPTACAPCACYLRAMRLLPVRPLAPARLRHARSRPPAARAQHAQHARAVPPSARPPSAHLRTPSTPCARLLRPACCASAPTTRPRLPSAQPAQWAVAIQVLYQFFFFSLYIFFFHLSATGKYQKIHLFISFIFQHTNKFIKIYFLYIFFFSNKPNKLLKFILLILLFQFTHCKLQGLFSNMPMCYLPKHTNIHITHTTYHTNQTHTYNHSSIHMITHKTHMPCPSFVPCLFLGNPIPIPSIKPLLVVMFFLGYGLSPISQPIGFPILILFIKPPKW